MWPTKARLLVIGINAVTARGDRVLHLVQSIQERFLIFIIHLHLAHLFTQPMGGFRTPDRRNVGPTHLIRTSIMFACARKTQLIRLSFSARSDS